MLVFKSFISVYFPNLQDVFESLEHLSPHIRLIHKKFPNNLKHKYLPKNLAYIEYHLTLITFFFTHVKKIHFFCLYPTSLDPRSISLPG